MNSDNFLRKVNRSFPLHFKSVYKIHILQT